MTVVDAIRVGGKQEGRQKERVTRKEKKTGKRVRLKGTLFSSEGMARKQGIRVYCKKERENETE